ncbi:hypothetical protein VPH35_047061 [Triticum aestivum]|nr:ENHANCER OF AG-4 protein 2-like [Triticum aestivum]XP_044342831.1 ENHANCER OF AG-4 protein 2-like [Triticum aestivum]
MSTGFSAEIFAQKLSKLNIAQQSIETLSHWCIFHHRCCQEVVDIWNKDFHSAPQERKISLLYLANDIMQNSKKDGMRYIHEFLKVIAAALDDLFTNGDDFGRNVVKRLVDIWEDRKLFGTQGQLLKEEYTRKFKELKSKKPGGELVEKVISSYKHMLRAPVDEAKLMRECNSALSFVDNLNKEYGNSYLGSSNGYSFVEELKEQHSILRNTIEQFKMSESLRATLVSDLKEALHEQEFKTELVRHQLRAAQVRYRKADDFCQKLGIDVPRHEPSNGVENSSLSEVPATFPPVSANANSVEKGRSTAVMYSREGDGGEPETLNGGFSSRATRGNFEQKIEGHPPGTKRQKIENGISVPQPEAPPPPPPPPLPYPDTFEQPPPPPQYPPSPESSPPPLPPSMPPPIPPPPPPPPSTDAFMPVPALPMGGMPYFPPFPPPVNYPMINMPPPFPGAPNPPHPGFLGFGGPFYGPPFPSAPHQ